jgi:hypothetical protein
LIQRRKTVTTTAEQAVSQSRRESLMPLIRANGIELFHELSGPEGAPVIVFSNSLGTNLTMWDAQAEALSASFRCLR